MASASTARNKADIWNRITLQQLVDAIVALGDRIDELKTETWRLNDKTKAPESVWNQLILSLNLDRSERTRQSLYNIWHKNRHRIRELVATSAKFNPEDGESDQDNRSAGKQQLLTQLTSSPIRMKPKRNVQTLAEPDEEPSEDTSPRECSITFTAAEWKEAFSHTHRKMKSGWTDTFAKKLTGSGFTCPVRFSTPSFKQGERKKKCNFLLCYAKCTLRICKRFFHISLPTEPIAGASALFLVRAYGKEKHDGGVETAQRRIRGDERLAMGRYCLFARHRQND